MYRIRSASGSELSYSSLEEFSAAVRRGEVHPEDEIFHTRANRWLDVKSHPHYRTATTWAGHEPHSAATAPRASVPPAPQSPSRSPSAPASSSSRAQVFERPVVRTSPQTTVRPQLQPAPAPEPVVAQSEAPARVGPPKKTKELAFIDLGDAAPAKPKAVVAEADVSPPAPTPPKAEPRPVPKLEIKLPAPPAPAPPEPAPAPAPPQAAAPAPAAPAAKAPPAEPTEPVTGPGSEVEFLVMDGGIESPVRTSAGYKTVPEDLDLLFDAPLPQARGEPPTRGVAVAGVPPKGAPTNRSGKVPGVPVPKDSPGSGAGTATATGSGRIEPDIEIPSGPLLEAPEPAVAPPPPRNREGGRSNAVLFGGGLVILAVAGTLLAWRPWKGSGTVADANAQPSGPVAPSPPMVGAPAPTPIRTPTTTGGTTPAGKQAGKGAEVPGGSATDSVGEDQVIVASKPTFRTDVAMPAPADFNVGADLGGKSTPATASPTELVRRLVTAERQAQQELDNRLASANFRNVLSADHLTSASGVTAARTAWSAGADAIRQYRGRIARLEGAYEDSVLTAQRGQRLSGEEMRAWASRQSLAEPTESSQLADLMFSQVSEGLEILAALSGDYTIKGQSIGFKNATSATRFTSIRGWVEQRTSTWKGIPETARPYSVTVILRALGEGFPVVQ
jgi:hypothetical protein